MAITEGQTPTTDNPMAAIRDAWIKGQDVEAAVYGAQQEQSAPHEEEAQEEIQDEVEAQPEAEAEQEEAKRLVEDIESAEASDPDSEVVYVRGAGGKKQAIEISYKDRQKIKDAYMKMAGMQKFRLERDEERKSKAEIQKKLEALSSDFGKLEQLFKDKGARGVFEQLGGPGAWEKAVESELKQREYVAGLSPEEKMQLNMQEKEKHFLAEKTSLERKYEEMMNKISQQQEQAAVKSLESRLLPAFEKYSFAGKLGDETAESKIDKAIWREVTENLAELPEEVELTKSLIEKEFRNASAVYNKIVNKQVDSKLKQTVAKKKEDAAVKAQVTVKKGLASNSLQDEVKSDIKNSNWSALMQKLSSGKVKL